MCLRAATPALSSLDFVDEAAFDGAVKVTWREQLSADEKIKSNCGWPVIAAGNNGHASSR